MGLPGTRATLTGPMRVAAVAFAFLVCRAVGQVESLEALLRTVTWTCPLPMEEETALNETAAGRILIDMSLELAEQVPRIAHDLARPLCQAIVNESFKGELMTSLVESGLVDREALYQEHVRICVTQTRRVAPDMIRRALLHCAPDATALCADIQGGFFCAQGMQNTSGLTCVLKEPGRRGRAMAYRCPPGFYCPGRDSSPTVCAKGYHCPEAVAEPLGCSLGHACLLSALEVPCSTSSSSVFSGASCLPAAGETRILLPQPCDRGSFCVDGLPSECPAGRICPEGTATPIVCKFLEVCPAGAYKPVRIPRALLENCMWLAFVAVVVVALGTDVLGPGAWRRELAVFLIVLALFWVVELTRAEIPTIAHAWFITAYSWQLLWGVFGSSILAEKLHLPEVTQLCLDAVACLTPVAIMYAVYRDTSMAVFLTMLWPGMAISYRVLVDAASSVIVDVSIVLIATAVLIGARNIWAPSWRNFVVTTVLVALLILPPVLLYLWRSKTASREEKLAIEDMKRAIEKDIQDNRRNSRGHLRAPHVPSMQGLARGSFRTAHRIAGGSILHADMEMAGVNNVSFLAARGASFVASPEPVPEVEDAGLASVQLGTASMGVPSVEAPVVQGSPALGIELRGMSLYLPNGQTILNDISLTIPAGSTVAVMGPSGSGKSSITNVLSGRAGYGIVTGQILINGRDDIGLEQLRNVTGFVPQDDVMHRNLTCGENVAFQAKLRLPPKLRRPDSGAAWAASEAERMLKLIGLAHVRNSLIGDESSRGISGGQRKRVSIAMEFIARPAILFLDEPTSGLDSTTSHAVIELVTKSAKENDCTTAAVIHQPRYETFLLFDYVVLLAAGGYLTYAGKTAEVMKYFTEELGVTFPPMANPADIFMDAMTLDSARQLAASGSMSIEEADLKDRDSFGRFLAAKWQAASDRFGPPAKLASERPLPDLGRAGCSWGEAMLCQMRRGALQASRDITQHIGLGAMLVLGLVAIIYGLPAESDLSNILFQPGFAYFFLMLTQGVTAQRVFGGAERVVAWREAGIGANMILYFLGRDLASLVEVLIGTAIFSMVYWPLGPLLCSHHTVFWVTFAFIYAVYGLSFIWSIVFPPATAQMLSVVSSFLSFLLSGMQPTFGSLVAIGNGDMVYFMSLSPVRWAHGYLLWDHISKASGAQFNSPLVQYFTKAYLDDMAMPLQWINETRWSCSSAGSVRERWKGNRLPADDPAYVPPNAFVCSTGQLFLLGLYFRFAAVISLLAISKIRATGGGSVIEGPGGLSKAAGPVVNMIFVAFLVALTNFQQGMLLGTK